MHHLVINFTPTTESATNTLILSRAPGAEHHTREYAWFESIEAAIAERTKGRCAQGFEILEAFPDVFQAQGTIEDS